MIRDVNFALLGVIATVALIITSFVYVYNVDIDRASGLSDLDVKGIRLIQVYDDAMIDVVHAEITFIVDRDVNLGLGGDVVEITKPFGDNDGWTSMQIPKGLIVHYSGILLLTEPKSTGDEVSILFRHGGSMTEAVAEVEEP